MTLTIKSITLLSLFSFGIVFNFNTNAAIYTWTDKNGNKHFSDQPSPKNKTTTPVKEIIPKSHNNVKLVSRQNSQWQNNYIESQEKKAKLAAIEATEKSKKQSQCNMVKNRISAHDNRGRVYKINNKGEREYQSSKQIDNAKKQLMKDMKKYCH